MIKDSLVYKAFEVAAERYVAVGVDVNKALEEMKQIVLTKAPKIYSTVIEEMRREVKKIK